MLRNKGLLGQIVKLSQVRQYSMELAEVVRRLNKFAPTSLAESWDNVGLLLEPHTKRHVKKIILTNDLTEDVMKEAVDKSADLILSYHPPLFRALKKITSKSWKERIVAECLEKGIAIYSPHTSYDAVEGGVNDWLIKAFSVSSSSPLQGSTKPSSYSHAVECHLTTTQATQDITKLEQELFSSLQDQDVSIRVNNSGIQVLCNSSSLVKVLPALESTDKAVTITKLENVPIPGTGMGRKAELTSSLSVKDAVALIKTHLQLSHVRLALARGTTQESLIKNVAVCAGSGSSVLRGSKPDLWLTGEMSHHEVLDAVHAGTSVVLTDHSNSERGYLRALQPTLTSIFDNNLQVIMSETDRDPLEIV